MVLVLALAAALWGLGAVLRAPFRQRWTLIAALLALVLLVQSVLPAGHPMREMTGGSAAPWVVLGLLAALVAGYRQVLRMLRRRVEASKAPVAPVRPGSFAPAELDRYARHIILREIGGPGQKALKSARVLVIGAGGLGSPVLLYLAAAGVGTIGVIDDDVVGLSNLQRQIIHTDEWVGSAKVFSAQARMAALNPHVVVRPYQRRLTGEIAAELFAEYDLILDGSDNFDTRYLANRVAVVLGKPLISGAITQWEGQITLIDSAHGGPCYQCIFPERPADGLVPTCAEAGVAAPLPGVVGAMMAMEAVKVLTSAGEGLRGRLWLFDGLYGDSRVIGVKKREGCPVCGASG